MPLLLANIINRLPQRTFPIRYVLRFELDSYNEIDVKSYILLSLFDSLLDGLNDYTVDERGDVGSWIRISCVKSLTAIIETLITRSTHIEDFESYLPPLKYNDAIKGILKQGVERLDNVRQDSGLCFYKLLRLSPPEIPDSGRWTVTGLTFFQGLFPAE